MIRGTGLPDHVFHSWAEGAEISDRAFTSSTANITVAEGFAREAIAKGEHAVMVTIEDARLGADIRQISAFGHEGEVLYAPGARFRVVEMKFDDTRGWWNVRVKELQ